MYEKNVAFRRHSEYCHNNVTCEYTRQAHARFYIDGVLEKYTVNYL